MPTFATDKFATHKELTSAKFAMILPPLIGSLITSTILGLWIWRTLRSLAAGTRHVRRLHQIPCHRCTFCTGEWRLKCTVHPTIAFSEQAIGCRDFESYP
ncbi:MAG: hypothetical protein AB4050_01635 [Synechococcus sp.]